MNLLLSLCLVVNAAKMSKKCWWIVEMSKILEKLCYFATFCLTDTKFACQAPVRWKPTDRPTFMTINIFSWQRNSQKIFWKFSLIFVKNANWSFFLVFCRILPNWILFYKIFQFILQVVLTRQLNNMSPIFSKMPFCCNIAYVKTTVFLACHL